MNKTVINKLILLSSLTFVFSFANIASADQFVMRDTCNSRCDSTVDLNLGNTNSNYYPPQSYVNNTNYDYYNSNNGYQYSDNNANNYSNSSYSAPSAPTVNYANPTVSTAPARTVAVATVKKASTTTTTKTVASNTNTNTNTTSNSSNLGASAASSYPSTNYTTSNNNGLTALTLFGNSGFLPNTVFEWMLTIFLILVLILLVRQLRPVHAHDPHSAPVHH